MPFSIKLEYFLFGSDPVNYSEPFLILQCESNYYAAPHIMQQLD